MAALQSQQHPTKSCIVWHQTFTHPQNHSTHCTCKYTLESATWDGNFFDKNEQSLAPLNTKAGRVALKASRQNASKEKDTQRVGFEVGHFSGGLDESEWLAVGRSLVQKQSYTGVDSDWGCGRRL
jgi:hypothetical protein